jgi:hypothetical protein
VSAFETSKINIESPSLTGDASRFAFASDLSQITIGGRLRLGNGLRFDVAFVSSVHKSIVSFSGATIEGGARMSGASYQCVDSSISRSFPLPGGDVPYSANYNCTIWGLASDLDPLSEIGAQFDKKLAAVDSHADNRLVAVSTEFDGKLVALDRKVAALNSDAVGLGRELRRTRVELFAAAATSAVLLAVLIVITLLLFQRARGDKDWRR